MSVLGIGQLERGAGRKRSCLEGYTIWDKIPRPLCPKTRKKAIDIVNDL